jgi:NAD(P)-dependent dehydrogenase (short-subunit alcohol dehydrogenase family)
MEVKSMSKNVLITGSSHGIGAAAAIAFAKNGYNVGVNGNKNPEGAENISRSCMEYGIRSKAYICDVSKHDACKDMIESFIDDFGQIDVLVNNAGYGYFGPIETVPMEDARRQLEVNVFGLAEMTRLVLPAMRSQRSGRIVNIASIAGRAVFPFGGWYNVSKYSVEALSDALRMELKPFGIKVAIIEPGCIKTDWGIIAADHLDECSRGTAYEAAAHREAEAMRWGYTGPYLSAPSIIARAIVRAATSRCPRTRYRLGRFAFSVSVLHPLLPARWWDALVCGLMSVKVKK